LSGIAAGVLLLRLGMWRRTRKNQVNWLSRGMTVIHLQNWIEPCD
jgi:hypothetical protein